ncbi:MAG: hypothetical protein WCG47_08105 [Dermatophilaceae bacterium]
MTLRIVARATHHPGETSADVDVPGDGTSRIWWRSPIIGEPNDNFLLPLTLLVAMRTGHDVFIDGHLSPAMLGRVSGIQDLLRRWDPSLDIVQVTTSGKRTRPPCGSSPGAGSFFSGGVDSFHTALTHRDTLDVLVFVAGFDIRHTRTRLIDRVARANQAAAKDLHLRLVRVATNVRQFSHRYLTWAEFHGSAMAATAHVLALTRCYHPSSLSPGNALPYGSHPDLDAMWSSEGTEIIYDGYEVSRLDKTRVIAASDVARRYLRVCNVRDDEDDNCGRCEKCLRTLVALRIAGHRGPLPTFQRGLSLGDLATRRDHRIPALWQQNVDAAVAEGRDTALIQALVRSIDHPLGRSRKQC